MKEATWHARDSGGIVLYVPASTLTDIFSIGRRLVGLERAREAVGHCLDQLGIIPVDRAVLQAALLLPGPDFEDNVQIACAQVASLDLIVTRNAGDFLHATVPVVAPAAVAGFGCRSRVAPRDLPRTHGANGSSRKLHVSERSCGRYDCPGETSSTCRLRDERPALRVWRAGGRAHGCPDPVRHPALGSTHCRRTADLTRDSRS